MKILRTSVMFNMATEMTPAEAGVLINRFPRNVHIGDPIRMECFDVLSLQVTIFAVLEDLERAAKFTRELHEFLGTIGARVRALELFGAP